MTESGHGLSTWGITSLHCSFSGDFEEEEEEEDSEEENVWNMDNVKWKNNGKNIERS